MKATNTIHFPSQHMKLSDWWIHVLVKVEFQERSHTWEADFMTHGALRRKHASCGRAAKCQHAGSSIWHYIILDGVDLMGDEGRQAGVQAVFVEKATGLGIVAVAAIQNNDIPTDEMIMGRIPAYLSTLVATASGQVLPPGSAFTPTNSRTPKRLLARQSTIPPSCPSFPHDRSLSPFKSTISDPFTDFSPSKRKRVDNNTHLVWLSRYYICFILNLASHCLLIMAEFYSSSPETELGFEDVFHPRDAIARELDGSISPPREGTQRINKRCLKISSEDYPQDSNLALAFSELDIDETMVIPEVLFSK